MAVLDACKQINERLKPYRCASDHSNDHHFPWVFQQPSETHHVTHHGRALHMLSLMGWMHCLHSAGWRELSCSLQYYY
jgi:hypothetical protein